MLDVTDPAARGCASGIAHAERRPVRQLRSPRPGSPVEPGDGHGVYDVVPPHRAFSGSVIRVSTAKPWFMLVISTRPSAPGARQDGLRRGGPKPVHLPSVTSSRRRRGRAAGGRGRCRTKALPVSSSCRITGTAYSPVAAGSPGPFDRKMPSGSCAITSSKVDVAGSTVTRAPASARLRKMLRFEP